MDKGAGMASTDLIRDAVDAALDQRYTGASAQVPSRDLDNAASNPVLRDAVGLGGTETEAGTGFSTGVEGGGR